MPRSALLVLLAFAAAFPAAASAQDTSATTRVLAFEAAPWLFTPHVPAGEESHEAEEQAREADRAEGVAPHARRPREQEPVRELPAKAQATGLGAMAASGSRTRRAARSVTTPHFSVPTDFNGPGFTDAYAYPPDSMADVGPTQVLVAVNNRLRSYSKTTGLPDGAVDISTDAFFASVMSNYTSDPRVRFDRRSQRWFVVMIDVPASGANHVLIAVSDGPTLTPSTVWHFSSFGPMSGTQFADYPTLGIDQNALYIGAVMFDASSFSYLGSQAYVVRKSDVLAGSATPNVAKFDLSTLSVPQGVDAIDDSGGSTGYFVGVDASYYSRLDVVRVNDPGGTPSLGAVQAVSVPTTAAPKNVTTGSSTLDALDDRLFQATLRNGSIWSAQNIAVTSGGAGSSSGTRDGSRWYQLSIAGGGASLVQSGTVFDSASSNAKSYWVPSVAVNGQGHMAISGSVAGPTATPNAWYAARLASDPLGAIGAPVALTGASSGYAPSGDTGTVKRWGDYSYTTVDPTDDQTFWTVQEYAASSAYWGVRVAKIAAPPPPTPIAGLVLGLGSATVNLVVNGLTGGDGAAFFDPGSGFASRPSVSIGCGVNVLGVTVLSGTSLSLDLDTRGATLGLCPITVTNPDGQKATNPAALTIVANLLTPPTTTTTTTQTTTAPATPPPDTATTTATPALPTTTVTTPIATTPTSSAARTRCVVPKLRGHKVATARRLLRRAHCATGRIRRIRSRAVRVGRIIRTRPRAGSKVPAGTRVALTVRRR